MYDVHGLRLVKKNNDNVIDAMVYVLIFFLIFYTWRRNMKTTRTAKVLCRLVQIDSKLVFFFFSACKCTLCMGQDLFLKKKKNVIGAMVYLLFLMYTCKIGYYLQKFGIDTDQIRGGMRVAWRGDSWYFQNVHSSSCCNHPLFLPNFITHVCIKECRFGQAEMGCVRF